MATRLTPRQAALLKAVVLAHHESGRPVGSRALVDSGVVDASPSTVRYELGRLEELGLLDHPHTSAGRVPTDLGYRVYLDDLVEADDLPARPGTGSMDVVDRFDAALAETTQALAEATELLALVTSPTASGATIRHVEVVQLQPTKLVVVCITDAGDVTRHVVSTGSPVDPGLVDWAGEYLNERVTGMALGQNLLRSRLRSPELGPSERAILALVEPAFSDLAQERQEIHVGGSAALLDALGQDVQQVVNLVHALDERQRLLAALRSIAMRSGVPALGAVGPSRRVEVRIGSENDLPELRALSIVGAPYGLANRQLGMVGLVGPRAMDYPRAIVAARTAADTLSSLADALHAG